MREFMQNAITNREQAKQFVKDLNENDMLYHFDDDPADIVSVRSGFEKPLFTDEECAYISQRIEELINVIGYDEMMQMLCDEYEEIE
jgi:hypothetical protein